MRIKIFAVAAVALCALFVVHPKTAWADPPTPLSTDAYGRLPNIELMQVSPSGERIAYIAVNGDRRLLVVKDIHDKVLLSAEAGKLKVRDIDWAGDDHIVLTLSMTQSVLTETGEYDHSIVINLVTKKTFIVFYPSRNIFNATFGYDGAVARDGRWYGFFGGVTLQKTRGFEPTFNSVNLVDLYRVDLDTGESIIAAPGREYPHTWAVNAQGAVIAHSEYDPKSGRWSLRPGTEGGDEIVRLAAPYNGVSIAGMGRTPGTIVVTKDDPEEWSMTTGAHTVLAPGKVVGGYLFDPASRDLLGLTLSGDREVQVFFAPALQARQDAFRKALGPSLKILSWSTDLRRMALYTAGDGDAGTYWLADGKSVRPYAYAYPEIPDANVGPSRIVIYEAADGLKIHGILTLPPGRDARDLPLVVLPHGGPEGHDSLGFDWLAQAFAGHGYAVFQPNFRGSDGYGVAFRDAGFGQWGRKMQTDISDGVAELAREGIIDPKRACIVGASYGGYAALAGVTVQHGLYRCAVSYAGLSDLNYLLDHDLPEASTDNDAGRYLLAFLGAKSVGDEALKALSPARLAALADAPILLIHGADDTVVPFGQSREMATALRSAGKPVDLIQLQGEDHRLSQDVTRKAMLKAALAFVQKNNPAN